MGFHCVHAVNPWHRFNNTLHVQMVRSARISSFDGLPFTGNSFCIQIIGLTRNYFLSRPCSTTGAIAAETVARALGRRLLLGHTKLESTVRYLGIEVDDALEMAEQTEVCVPALAATASRSSTDQHHSLDVKPWTLSPGLTGPSLSMKFEF